MPRPPAWQRIGDALLTREPLRSRSTGLFVRLTYQGALDACAALGDGASLATADDIEALHEVAHDGPGAVEVAPFPLPTVAMVRAAGFSGSVNSAEYQAAAQALRVAGMRSIEWCRAHDAEVAARLSAAGWDGVAAVAGAGKHWVAGAPPGRAWLFGWWDGQRWIQPRPALGSQGPHDRSHSDYATTTIARRPLDGAAGADPGGVEGDGSAPVPLPSPHFSPGRPSGPPLLLVLHTTENDCAPGVAAAVARYFAAPSTQASAHYVVGPDAVYQCVADTDRAWHVGARGNPRSIGVEQTGRARFSAAEWQGAEAQAMLARVVALLAALCRRWGIPPVVIEGPALAASGASGITTHAAIAAALGGTTHWDPGPAYPLDVVVARAAAVVGSPP